MIEHRSAESDGLRFDSSRELRIFSLSHARDKTKKKTFSNEKDVCVLSRARVKETILSSREESNLKPSDSALRCSITEPQRLYGEQSLLRSSYDARSVYC